GAGRLDDDVRRTITNRTDNQHPFKRNQKMKLKLTSKSAFTIAEMAVALAASSAVLGATLTSSTSLQKSFNAVDNYFGTHMQQIRIVNYLSRDVKRGLVVTPSVDRHEVTATLPDSMTSAGDP